MTQTTRLIVEIEAKLHALYVLVLHQQQRGQIEPSAGETLQARIKEMGDIITKWSQS